MTIIEKIQLLIKAREPVTAIVNEVEGFRAGFKTAAFWVSLIGSLIALATALAGFMPPLAALCLTTGLTVLYNIARGAEKADQEGVRPMLQSTEFWLGVLNSVGNGLVALQTGGVNPAWMASTQTIIAAAMAGAQNLGAQQPGTSTK